MKISFSVIGESQGKGRPKFSRRGGFVSVRTPDATVVYENLIRLEYERQCGGQRFGDGDMLDMCIKAYYAIPKSASQKKRREMKIGEIRPTKKPDADNVLKAVADSLNNIAYKDDSQLVEARVMKFYSYNPRLEVTIQNVQPT